MPDTLADLYAILFDPGLVTAPAYLAFAGLAAFWVWRREAAGRNGAGDRGVGFWRWLVPGRIWRHPSHLIDLQLFVLGRLMAILGLFAGLAVTTFVAAGVARLIPAPLIRAESLGPVALAVVLWLPSDFSIYWVHRIYHRWARIWPLHAVHHSAEVMTPFTTYRQHPVANLLTSIAQAVFVGLCQGLLIGTLAEGTAVAEIAGLNLCIVLANAALAALHHSHVWLSYGPVLEHLLISPAQHQIHHSVDPAHHDRNFGNSLALWDWMFGTLYVIQGREHLTLGLAGEAERALMTQRLGPMLWDPLRRLLQRGPKG